MKYLLQAIEAERDVVRLSDSELRKLLVEVRSGKDDRIEFTESMTRLIEELRSNEHATAFLTKVAKREAPDYYDVIKNPMDLGTMLRNVKSGKYKSKAQFMRDLDLIWDNCLTYNSEPTHVLRRSVQILRAKADHLLTYVNDTNDVKEALNQWQPSSGTVTERMAGTPFDSGTFSPLNVGINGLRKGSIFVNGRSLSMGLKQVNASLVDTPFEQRPALQRTTEGMSTFSTLDQGLSHTDEQFARTYLLSPQAEAGPSSKPLQSVDTATSNGITNNAIGDILRTLDSSSTPGCFQAALTMGSRCDSEEVNGNDSDSNDFGSSPTGLAANRPQQRKRRKRDLDTSVPYPFQLPESLDGPISEECQLGAWWNAVDRSSLLVNGITTLASSMQIEPKKRRTIGYRGRKKRRKGDVKQDRELFGGVQALESNVTTISKLRKTHAKYGALVGHIEHEEPIPAALAVVSSDEESEEESKDIKEDVKKSRIQSKEVDMPPAYIPDPLKDPLPKLSSEGATDILESKTQFLLAHAGFEGTQKGAAGVLADVAAEYMMNIGRTFRMYLDQFAKEMSVEEIVLHALFENGGMDVRSLESYIVDDVVRYGGKMSELLKKLQASYRDTLTNATFTMEDEAYFADDQEGVMSGTFAQDMGDDFFGFKEMGLDKELGIDMSRLIVPSKLFNKGAGGARAGGRGGMGGMGVNGIAGAKGSGNAADFVMFEPPPPYIPISEASIPAQIEILQPFYRELLRNRGQWQDRPQSEDEEEDIAENDADDEEGETPIRRKKRPRRIFVLPDEEQEKQRYKVPPNGKLPKRAFKSKDGDIEGAEKTKKRSTSISNAAQGQNKSKSAAATSNKKKKKDPQ